MNLIAKCALAAAACMPLAAQTVASAATKSDFSSPSGLTSNAAGDVFVANSGSGKISEITPTLTIKTVKDGNSLSSNIDPFRPSVDSVTVGGSTVYAFAPEAEDYANGSFALRQLSMQQSITGFASTGSDFVGSSCAAPAAPELRGECWTADATYNQLIHIGADEADVVALPYQPEGIAFVASKHRLFVSDASQNTISVYKTSPFARVKTLH